MGLIPLIMSFYLRFPSVSADSGVAGRTCQETQDLAISSAAPIMPFSAWTAEPFSP